MTDPSDQDRQPTTPIDAVHFDRGAWAAMASIQFSFSRSSGPGGQAVNKVNTRAELRIALDDLQGLNDADRSRLRTKAGQRLTNDGEIVITADTHRSQRDNRNECIDRLVELVNAALKRPKPRKRTRPSRAQKEARLRAKREHSEKKKRRRPPDA